MGKEKKAVEFNPADYDYLDGVPLKVYIAAFLERNMGFIEDMKKVYEKDKEYEEAVLEVGPEDAVDLAYEAHICCEYITHKYNVKLSWNSDEREYEVELPVPVTAVRIVDESTHKGKKMLTEIKEKERLLLMNDDRDSAALSRHVTQSDMKYSIQFTGPLFRDISNNSDRLILALDLNSTREIIDDRINKALEFHKSRRPASLGGMEKWKDYLMVFDLKEQGLDYKAIADLLYEMFPDNKNFESDRNINTYYDKAVDLINGGYNRYI